MENKIVNVDALGLDPIPAVGTEIPDELKPTVTGENRKGISETVDAVIFVLALGTAVKASLSDGKVTVLDAANFLKPVSKFPAFLTGIKDIPGELSDTITEEEQSEIIQAVVESGIAEGKAESIAIEAIDLALHIKNFVFKNFIEK